MSRFDIALGRPPLNPRVKAPPLCIKMVLHETTYPDFPETTTRTEDEVRHHMRDQMTEEGVSPDNIAYSEFTETSEGGDDIISKTITAEGYVEAPDSEQVTGIDVEYEDE